jgi:hypothetical protein
VRDPLFTAHSRYRQALVAILGALTLESEMTGPQVESQERNAMSSAELLAWAWRETPPVHRSTGNLLIHIVAVPMFVVGLALLIAAVTASRWLLVAGSSCIVAQLLALPLLGWMVRQPPGQPGPELTPILQA